MRVLLSYSSQHFDPNIPAEQQVHRGSSANVISRTLYRALSRRGEVTFVDAAEPDPVAHGVFDLFIGIQRNFTAILESISAERRILAAVNMHPAEHNELLLDFAVREGLTASALHALDIQDVDKETRALEVADSILLFGNERTLESYVRHGIPSGKISLTNYGVDLGNDGIAARSERPPREVHLLYGASEIGLRKGFDIVAELAEEADLGHLGEHLHIVGSASYPHYRAKLSELEGRLRPHVTNHGWLMPSGREYRELLERCDYLLFPSLEEGQAGTVLDAMACGVIPLISRNCGVDFSPLGFCELRTNSAKNREILRQACALPVMDRDRLRVRTLEHYDEFHAGFEERLEVALDDHLGSSIEQEHLRLRRAPLACGANGGERVVSFRERTRRRYLVMRARWLSSWRFHQILGGMRRRLPI